MRIGAFHVLPCLLLLSTVCCAEQDFYGIQMKNELWAQNLVLGTGPQADPKDLNAGPILSHQIHAEASLKPLTDNRLDFQVNVINDSRMPIVSDYRYRDFFIYTRDGSKYSLIDGEDNPRLDSIEPKSSRVFNPSLGKLNIQNDQVRMIRCSFDVGRIQIFLFPWSKKEAVARLVSPEPLPELQAQNAKWLRKSDKERVSSASPTRERLNQAIKNFIYKPASVANAPIQPQNNRSADENLAAVPEIRAEAHVISYNKTYNFITLDIGLEDGLRQDMAVSILRNGKTVAKAQVKRLRDNFAAAILLPGTIQTEIHPGDKISFV